MKILVTGDLHLGRRSSSVSSSDVKTSAKYTWENIVQYSISKQIDILLLTGDIVDRDNRFYEAIGPLQAGFNKLSQEGIPVYMVAGNHDYDVLPQIISMNKFPGIKLLGAKGEWESCIHTKNSNESVRILGWSFTEKYIFDSALDMDFPEFNDDMPTLAIIHGDAYQSISKYNPMKGEKLKHISGVDAWLFGHIHKPDVINNENPLILYPGSPHALNPNEKGIHGVWLITIDDWKIDYQDIPLSPVCYQTLTVDVSTINSETEFRKLIISAFNNHLAELMEFYAPQYVVFDIELTGTNGNILKLRKWSDEITNYTNYDTCNIIVRTIEYNIQPEIHIEQLLHEPSYIGVLANAIKAIESGSSNAFVDKLTADWIEKYEHLTSVPVYIPLKARKPEDELKALAKDYILKECRELITELNLQRNEN